MPEALACQPREEATCRRSRPRGGGYRYAGVPPSVSEDIGSQWPAIYRLRQCPPAGDPPTGLRHRCRRCSRPGGGALAAGRRRALAVAVRRRAGRRCCTTRARGQACVKMSRARRLLLSRTRPRGCRRRRGGAARGRWGSRVLFKSSAFKRVKFQVSLESLLDTMRRSTAGALQRRGQMGRGAALH